jgi:hypothetical protein
MKRSSTPFCVRGFTLVEALLAAAVLAMAVSAILMPFTAGIQNEQVGRPQDSLGQPGAGNDGRDSFQAFRGSQGSETPGRTPARRIAPCSTISMTITGTSKRPARSPTQPAGLWTSRRGRVVPAVTAVYVHVNGQDESAKPTFIRVGVEVSYQDQPVVKLTRLVYAMR